MSHSNRLRSTDYAALLRILGEVGELPPDPLARRRHALRELCRAVDAQCGIFCHTTRIHGHYRLLDHLTVGLDEAPRGMIDDYFGGRLPLDPCALPIERLDPADTAAVLRRQLVPDPDWYHDEHVNGMRATLDLDDGIYARIVSPRGNAYGFSVIRNRKDRPFTERHRQLVALFNANASSLYRLDDPLDPLAKLAPRLRPVAERFLVGDSVKQAAIRLGLSRHTVVEYAKVMHRTYGVSSRAELLLALMGRSPQ